jgi:hypothetical protein
MAGKPGLLWVVLKAWSSPAEDGAVCDDEALPLCVQRYAVRPAAWGMVKEGPHDEDADTSARLLKPSAGRQRDPLNFSRRHTSAKGLCGLRSSCALRNSTPAVDG